MTIKDLKPFLFTLFVCFSCSFTMAQLLKTPQAIPKDLNKLKGRLPWPVDNIKELFTHEQALRNSKRLTYSCAPMPFLTIRSDSATVVKNSVTGIVSRIFDIEGSYTIMMKHQDYSLIYSNLDTVFVKKGDTVFLQQPIGKINTPNYYGLYELEIVLFNKSRPIDPYDWFIPIDKPTPIY